MSNEQFKKAFKEASKTVMTLNAKEGGQFIVSRGFGCAYNVVYKLPSGATGLIMNMNKDEYNDFVEKEVKIL